MEYKCPYRHLPLLGMEGSKAWNGSVRWNGIGEREAEELTSKSSEVVITGM